MSKINVTPFRYAKWCIPPNAKLLLWQKTNANAAGRVVIPTCSKLNVTNLISLKEIVGKCPYCDDYFTVDQMNCKIFRHAYYKTDNKQFHVNKSLPPHLSKQECDKLRRDGKILGCGGAIEYVDGKFVRCSYDR